MSCHQEPAPSPRNKRLLSACYLMAAGFLLMFFASRSSFLYPCNDWNDANSYFSVGKALFNGKMPYRDVFDQKGMYLYFLYGLAYLISHTTFAGVFVLEGILAAFDLFGICRILMLSMKRSTALALSPLVLAVIVSSRSFYWGGSAEEICLPFLVWGLYLLLDYFQNRYAGQEEGRNSGGITGPEVGCPGGAGMSRGRIFLGGILAGMVANIKFTLLGFFFAWMLCVFLAFLVRRDFAGAVRGCFLFLGGMALPFLPWVVYFGLQGGLYEWYWGYVYINVFVYSNLNGEGPSPGERIYTLSKLLYWVIRTNSIYFIFIILGGFWFIIGKGRKWLERLCAPALGFFLFLGIYVGGSELPYYALPLAVFTVLGFAFLGQAWEWALERAGRWDRTRAVERPQSGEAPADEEKLRFLRRGSGGACMALRAAALSGALVLGVGIIWTNSMNIPHRLKKKEDIFLYQFQKIVVQTPEPTLLNINCLDAGLYTVCDIVPTCRWFQTQTLAIDDVLREQERYIREGRTDYVIARDYYPEVIGERYELVAQAPWQQEGMEFTYYLFRLRGGERK